MAELIVPGETPEAEAERKANEDRIAKEAELKEVKEKLCLLGPEDSVELTKLKEKQEYWREKAARKFQEAGGQLDMGAFRMAVRSAAFQDILDILDPSGLLRKKYEVLYEVHAKHLLDSTMPQLAAMKALQAQAEAQAFMEQQAHQKSKGNGANPAQGSRSRRHRS